MIESRMYRGQTYLENRIGASKCNDNTKSTDGDYCFRHYHWSMVSSIDHYDTLASIKREWRNSKSTHNSCQTKHTATYCRDTECKIKQKYDLIGLLIIPWSPEIGILFVLCSCYRSPFNTLVTFIHWYIRSNNKYMWFVCKVLVLKIIIVYACALYVIQF